MIFSVAEVHARRPEWVRRQIKGAEHGILAKWIKDSGAICGAEVGVASGYSSAVLVAAMGKNTDSPQLHSFDLSTSCYFDRSRNTGDAFAEIHGSKKGFNLTTGITSDELAELPPLDFIFIDGSHATPWPALDVLSLCRFIKPEGWIALDDVDMPFSKRWNIGGKNGARDLFRAWRGRKTRYAGATSLALLEDPTPDNVAQSVANSMLVDWDVALGPDAARRFGKLAEHYGADNAALVRRVLQTQRNTHLAWKPETPKDSLFEIPA